MLPSSGDVVARGILFDDLDVGNQPGTREGPFEKIVTQQRVLGNAVFESRLEEIHIVDSLSGVRPFAKEVLVHIGHGKGVWIQAARARKDALVQRALPTRRQDGVTRGCSTACPSTTRLVR